MHRHGIDQLPTAEETEMKMYKKKKQIITIENIIIEGKYAPGVLYNSWIILYRRAR